MAMEDYSGEFKADAVALYKSLPGQVHTRGDPQEHRC